MMRSKLLIASPVLFLFLLVALVANCSASASNLIANADFETDANADGTPDGYVRNVYGGTPTVTLDTYAFYTGTKSVNITGTSAADRASIYYNYTNASGMAGNTYTYSIYEKTSNVISSSYGTVVRISFLDSASQEVKPKLFLAGATGTTSGWTKLEVSFTVPYGIDRIVIEPFLWLASGTVWWDNASLVQQNLLDSANPSFEQVTAGTLPDGYTKSVYAGTPTVASDTAEHHDGAKSVKMTGAAATDRASLYFRYMNASTMAGNTYTYSIYQKTSNIVSSNYGTTVRITFLNASSQAVGTTIYVPGAKGTTAGWKKLQTTFTVPYETASIVIEPFLFQATGTVWWDDAELTPFTASLVGNPGYETDSDNDGIPDAWHPAIIGSSSYAIDASTVHNGSRSVRLTGTATAGSVSLDQDLAIPSGMSGNLFTLRSWYKTSSLATTGNGAAVKLVFYNSSGTTIGSPLLVPGLTGTVDWTQLDTLVLAPAGTVKIKLYVMLDHASGTVWWDQTDLTPFQFVTNGSFEQDVNGAGVADGWTYTVSAGAPTITLDSSEAYEGTRSLKMTGSSLSDAAYARQVITLPTTGEGVSAWGYRVSVYQKALGLTSRQQGAALLIAFKNANNATLAQQIVRGRKETQDWTAIVKDVSVPYGAVAMDIRPMLSSAGGTVWWDALTVTPVTMLDNRDFELDANADQVPDGWTYTAANGSPRHALDTATYLNDGTNQQAVRSFAMTGTSLTDQASLAQTVPLSAAFQNGGVLTVNYQVDQAAASAADLHALEYGPRVKLTFLDNSGAAVGNPLYAIAAKGTAAWAALSQSFIPPAGAAKIKVELQLWNATGTVWWDRAELLPTPQIGAETTKMIGAGSVYQEGRPAIAWRKANNAAFYTIQYSQDPTFATNTTTVSNWLATAYVPAANMADGTWYTRGKTTDAANATTGYGPVNKFFIQRLQAFPDAMTPNADGANDTTTLNYILQDTAAVTLTIRDAAAAVVKTLYSGATQNAGAYNVVWDGQTDAHTLAADGTYTAQLSLTIGGVTYTSDQTITIDAADTHGYRGLENDKDWSGFYANWIDKSAQLAFDYFDPDTGRYSYDSLTNALWPVNTANYAFMLAYEYTTPTSHYYNNTTARDRAIAAFDAVVDYEVGTTGSWARERDLDANQDRFELAALAETYPMLQPSIDATKQAKWEGFLQRAAQYQIDTYKTDPTMYGIYPNQDQTYALALAAVGNITGDSALLTEAAAVVALNKDQTIRPNGGMTYIDGTNPSAGYQDLLGLWARYYELTGDSNIPAIMTELTDYFPLVMEVDGVSEYGSSPELKNYWQTLQFPMGADTVAHFTSDGRNKMVANTMKERLTRTYPAGEPFPQQVWLTALGRNMTTPSVTPVKLTDQGVVKDPDIDGLRARWGTFTATITAGKVQPTLVSAVVNNTGNPFAAGNGALGWDYFESKTGNLTGERPADWGYLFPARDTATGDPVAQPGLTVQQVYINNKIGAQQAKYIPVPYYGWLMKSDASANWDWNVQQTWVVFQNRLIGMNTMRVKDTNTTQRSGASHFARSRLAFGPAQNGELNTQAVSDDLYGNYNQLGFWLNKQPNAGWEFNTNVRNGMEPGLKAASAGFRSSTQVAIQKKPDGSGNVSWGPYSANNAGDTMSYNAVFFPLGAYNTSKDWHDSADNNITFGTPQADVHAAVMKTTDGSHEVYVAIVNHSAAAASGSLAVALTNGSYTLSRYEDGSGTAAATSTITVGGGSYSLAYSLAAGALAIYKINP